MKRLRSRHTLLWLLLPAVCFGACGCVERILLLRTDPPGARVVVNGAPIAEPTPVAIPFQTYGTFEVVASLENHRRLRTDVPVSPPWYEQIPFDFFAENIWPLTLHDKHVVTLEMQPIGTAEDSGIDQREEAARNRLSPKRNADPEAAPGE